MLFDIRDVEYKVQDVSILSKLNLNVEVGKPLLLLGPSGCGKTTLMNLMAGLLKASTGDIMFDGQNFTSLSESCLLYTSPSPRDQRGSRMPSSA